MKSIYQLVVEKFSTEIDLLVSGNYKHKNIYSSYDTINTIIVLYISQPFETEEHRRDVLGIGLTGFTISPVSTKFKTISTKDLPEYLTEEEFFSFSTSYDFCVDYETFSKIRIIQNKLLNHEYK